MNLLNIPKSYIPSSEEMILLSDIIDGEHKRVEGRSASLQLQELQRKLSLLDGIFRAAEEPSWDEHLARLVTKASGQHDSGCNVLSVSTRGSLQCDCGLGD